MWQVRELIPHVGKQTVAPKKRLFFAIYYTVEDNAFKRAAQAWARTVKLRHSFSASNDYFYEKEISTEAQFNAAWGEIYDKATNDGYQVHAGNLLTHASKQTDRGDGLEFKGGTLTHQEIVSMRRLPWTESGFLILAGCNTGLTKDRKWAPAYSFALAQKIPTVGQPGYAYFSTNWPSYSRIGDDDNDICLWAYDRSANATFLGSGTRMTGIVFKV
jgi:hypothetical protein